MSEENTRGNELPINKNGYSLKLLNKPCKRGHAINRHPERGFCIECKREDRNQYRSADKEAVNKYMRDRYKNNPEKAEKIREHNRQWAKNNKQKRKETIDAWKKANPDKMAEIRKRRFERERNATPHWADKEKIKQYYGHAKLLTMIMGEQYTVDHIIPLGGKNVCGLHVHYNLQVIPLSENSKKWISICE